MSKEILNVETNEVKPSTTRGWIAYILNKLKGVNGPEINKRINSLDNSISNPNELLNSNFNLWSFGNSMTYTETNAKKYCADRWFIQSDGNLIYAKKKITDGKTTIEVDASSQNLYTNLMQDFSGEWYNNNKGKTVTITVKFAAKVKDIKVGIVLYPTLFTDSKIATEYTDTISYTTKVPDMNNNTYGGFYIQTDKPMVFEVEYMKVELSEKATQYIPPINSDELLRCSMYENDVIRQPYSNPNLVINGDFQVWQRGTSFSFNATGTAFGYTADRFIAHAEGTQAMTVTKGDDGLYMNFTNSNNGTSNLTTYFPYDEVKKWKGKIMTATVEYKSDSDNWEPYAFIFVNPTDSVITKLLKIDKIDLGSGWKRLITTFKVEDVKDTMVHFQIQWLRSQMVGSLQGLTKVRSVKLEYGQYSTPFISKPYLDEVMECNYYYQLIPIPMTPIITDNNQLVVHLKCNCPMRTVPTFTWDSKAYLHGIDTGTVLTLCSNISNPEVKLSTGSDYIHKYGSVVVDMPVTVAAGKLWTINDNETTFNNLSGVSYIRASAEII